MHLVTVQYGVSFYIGVFLFLIAVLYLLDIFVFALKTSQPKNIHFIFLLLLIVGLIVDSGLFILTSSTNALAISHLNFGPHTDLVILALYVWTGIFSFPYMMNNWMEKMNKGGNVKEWMRANFIRTFLMIITLLMQVAVLGYCWPLVKIFYYFH